MKLTLYTRPGCHLCEEMKDTIARIAREIPLALELEEIDISKDAALEHAYGQQIPVLFAGGRKLAKYRVAVDELRRTLARLGELS